MNGNRKVAVKKKNYKSQITDTAEVVTHAGIEMCIGVLLYYYYYYYYGST